MKKIKGILLDLDDTLYEYGPCNRAGMEEVLERLSKTHKKKMDELQAHFEEARSNVKKLLSGTASSHSRLLYLKRLVERLVGRTEPAEIIELEEAFWGKYFEKMRLYDGARVFLLDAKKSGLKIGILTNLTAAIQLKKLMRLGIDSHVDYVMTSEEVGAEKPSPLAFEYALRTMGMKPEELLMLGDSLEDDVKGAKMAGIRAVHVQKGFFVKPKRVKDVLGLAFPRKKE